MIVNATEDNRASYCKALSGKVLFIALHGTYTVALKELKSLLKASNSAGGTDTTSESVKPSQDDGFKEVRKRKRHSTNEAASTSKKPAAEANNTTKQEVATLNFFAPLWASTMETDSSGAEATTLDDAVPGKAGRPPPIILTSTTNLFQLQRQLKNVSKGDFEFRNTKNGSRVITKSMTDFEAVKSYFSTHNLAYYSFFPKSQKPIKAVLRHLPSNTPAEDISEGLVTLGFDIISVKQMTICHRSPSEGTSSRNLPLYLITLPRTAKSQETFKLQCVCHISIRVEAYRAQSGLTQCHNCQQFGHVWANCRQPPHCMWCGGGHLHKECPEKNTSSTPVCCNCQLVEGEKPHPANYCGCRHVKETLQRKKLQRAPKLTTGRVFSSNAVTPGVSFVAALQGGASQEQQPLTRQLPVAVPPKARKSSVPAPVQGQETGQSVQAPNVSSHPFDNMLKVVTVVQQIMTEISSALSEEEKIVDHKNCHKTHEPKWPLEFIGPSKS
jgi:hypothetical protein